MSVQETISNVEIHRSQRVQELIGRPFT